MRNKTYRLMSLVLLVLVLFPLIASSANSKKQKIAVVSSYHPEYTWSQQTNDGVIAGLIEFGYLDNSEQGKQYSKDFQIESSKAIIKKWWMDTKRKNSQVEIAKTLNTITGDLDQFKPDIILLGDDNAAKYVGTHYLDSDIPVVFWGVNGIPLKYGLLDSIEKPGHNVTGVYQAGYHFDSISYLKKIIPGIKKIAVLSDDSPTGRSHAKKIKRYGDEGQLEAQIVKVVMTNSFEEWKKEALELQQQVDAFYMSTYQTLKDDNGKHVGSLDAVTWYLENIRKPEVVPSNFIVKDGLLSTVDDSAYKQGYEAIQVAHLILSGQATPAETASYAPGRGPFIVNRWRARQLGMENIIDQNRHIIDEVVDESAAWKRKESSE